METINRKKGKVVQGDKNEKTGIPEWKCSKCKNELSTRHFKICPSCGSILKPNIEKGK